MTGIIAAMKTELELIRNKLDNVTEEKHGGLVFYRGSYKGKETVAAICGIGKVYASMCAEAMTLLYAPDVIINTGVAGALSDKLHMLDCTVADKCVQYDMDTSPLGDPVGFVSGISKIYFPADKDLSDRFAECCKKTGKEPVVCTVASGDAFVADTKKKKWISKEFGASVCDMESAAIAHVCTVNGVPFIISRCISDGADDGAKFDFPTMCGMAADISSNAVLEFIERYGG